MKALLKFAVAEERVARNVAADVTKAVYAARKHKAWSIGDIERYVARKPPGTDAFLAVAVLLGTAGRREDAVRVRQLVS